VISGKSTDAADIYTLAKDFSFYNPFVSQPRGIRSDRRLQQGHPVDFTELLTKYLNFVA
jgi:hypothetical protein